MTPRTPIGRSCSQTSYLAPPPLGPGGLPENMIDAKQRDVESGLLKVVSKADVMILFGLVALDQVPLRHFFIVSASCETTRTGMAVAAPAAAQEGFDVLPAHSTVPRPIPNNRKLCPEQTAD